MSTWIPISERLPTREDADERGEVVWKWADGTTHTGRFEDGGEEQDPAVAWHPLAKYPPPIPREIEAHGRTYVLKENGNGRNSRHDD